MAMNDSTISTPAGQSPIEVTAYFNDAVARVAARNIIMLAKTDPQAAREHYQQHISAMDESERELFNHYIAQAGMLS